jgi:hypothetical protein
MCNIPSGLETGSQQICLDPCDHMADLFPVDHVFQLRKFFKKEGKER